MDVAGALAEWYNLIDCITPRSKTEKLYMRLKEHSYYRTDGLIDQIDQLVDFYDTDQHMFFEPPGGTRCRHVFVAALKTDAKKSHLGYNLFRTYDRPKDARLLEGPSDPRTYKISHAFGVTGAAKYFAPPWKETSANKVKHRFLDIQFPSPHNITELALDEMWGLYGTEVEISVVVNIGPGNVNASDCRMIAKRFSWGRKITPAGPALSTKKQSVVPAEAVTKPEQTQSPDNALADEKSPKGSETLPCIKFDKKPQAPAGETDRKAAHIRHHKTFGSEYHMDIKDKLRRDESDIENNIRNKLRNIYPENPPPYYRLAPDISAPRTAKNDTSYPGVAFDATKQYLQTCRVEVDMDEVGQCVHLQAPVLAN